MRSFLFALTFFVMLPAVAQNLQQYRVTLYYPSGKQIRTYVWARSQTDAKFLAQSQFPNVRIGLNKVGSVTH